jgi:UDP-N-acetylmuramate dehydrogenase
VRLTERRRRALRRLAAFTVENEPLAPHTTYRLGGPAALFARPRSLDELLAIAAVAGDEALPVLVIGRGSNMLVADRGFAGIAVSLDAWRDDIEIEGTEVRAGAAVALPVLARRTAAAGLTGFEWAVGVPGSIGGAVRMNAGGHGSDMTASLRGVHIVDLLTTRQGWLEAASLGLRFRGSDLADHQVVVDAVLDLQFGDPDDGETAISEIVRWRREHQPGGQNAGSVFVNPVPGELAAAQLIDGLGLRGTAVGGAFVSDKHANFIQAGDGATAADVRAVMEFVRGEVFEKTGFLLRSEVRLVGFADIDDDRREGVPL